MVEVYNRNKPILSTQIYFNIGGGVLWRILVLFNRRDISSIIFFCLDQKINQLLYTIISSKNDLKVLHLKLDLYLGKELLVCLISCNFMSVSLCGFLFALKATPCD